MVYTEGEKTDQSVMAGLFTLLLTVVDYLSVDGKTI